MKAKLANVALLTASIVFSLLILEVSLRAFHNEWGYMNFGDSYTLLFENKSPVTFDSELGWLPKQGVEDWGGVVTILEDGIRSNGSGQVVNTTESILAVGDSFTFGSQVSDWETWPAQLEKLFGTRVINGGVGAYGIDQAFLRARRLLDRYRFSTVIFSFISDDISRCRYSKVGSAGKPYFDFNDGRLTLENVPVPPPSPRRKESELLIALEHSRLVHAVMKRAFPEWWLGRRFALVQTEEQASEITCALFHALEGLAKTRGFKLIVLVQLEEGETLSESIRAESVLSCLSDPSTRVVDLKPALSEMKAKDLTRYNRMYVWRFADGHKMPGHMSAEGNQFVALYILKVLTHQASQPSPAALR